MSYQLLLPPEMERAIFETTALVYPETILRLLGAQRVKIWIEPILYEIVTSYSASARDLEAIKRTKTIFQHPFSAFYTLMQTTRKDLFRKYTRNICLTSYLKAAEMDVILSICAATSNLACLEFLVHPQLVTALNTLPLRRLSISLSALFPRPTPIDFTQAFFANLTHLEINDHHTWTDSHWGTGGWPGYAGLASLPHLTHLAVRDTYLQNDVLQGALAHCKRLVVLVSICTVPSWLEGQVADRAALVSDPRLVITVLPWKAYPDDWGLGARGERDFWLRAEEMVERRRVGSTKGAFYSLS